MSKVILRTVTFCACFLAGSLLNPYLAPSTTLAPPLQNVVGQTVDITFRDFCFALWLRGGREYDNLVLLSVEGDRLVFQDVGGQFIRNTTSRVKDIERYNAGFEGAPGSPRLLGGNKFSIQMSAIKTITKDGEVVWQQP